MTTPNPATLQKIRQTQMEGDQAQQEAVQSQQTAQEQRLQKAQRDAQAARLQQIRDLSASLQGLPGGRLEALRESASSGFDTRGTLAGQPLALPPPVPPPTPLEPREKPVPPEKVTPEIRGLLNERNELRGRMKQMEASLKQFESKGVLTPQESAAMTKLRQELQTTLNKENYLTFSINESIP